MTDDVSAAETSLGLIVPPSQRRQQESMRQQRSQGSFLHTPEFKARVQDEVREDEHVEDEEVALRSVVTTEAESKVIEEEKLQKKQDEEDKKEREELAKMERQRITRQQRSELEGAPKTTMESYDEDQEEEDELEPSKFGNILEAAFVDPAYPWPAVEGAGRNAIELQASVDLLSGDNISVGTTESMRERMTPPERPVLTPTKRWWQCCKKDKNVIDQIREYERKKLAAKEARKAYAHLKKEKKKQKELARRMQTKYNRIPEGILIYRLDTSKKRLMLMSPPHDKTDLSTLVVEMTVVSAYPSDDKSRRGIVMVGADGQEVKLMACEQRTAVSWLEAINLMTAKAEHSQKGFSSLLMVSWMKINTFYSTKGLVLTLFFPPSQNQSTESGRNNDFQSTSTTRLKSGISTLQTTPTNLFERVLFPEERRAPVVPGAFTILWSVSAMTLSTTTKKKLLRLLPNGEPSLRTPGTFTA